MLLSGVLNAVALPPPSLWRKGGGINLGVEALQCGVPWSITHTPWHLASPSSGSWGAVHREH